MGLEIKTFNFPTTCSDMYILLVVFSVVTCKCC